MWICQLVKAGLYLSQDSILNRLATLKFAKHIRVLQVL